MKYLEIMITKGSGPNRFLCWNSFKSTFYWGPRRLSEQYAFLSEIANKHLNMFPGSKLEYLNTTPDIACVTEETR